MSRTLLLVQHRDRVWSVTVDPTLPPDGIAVNSLAQLVNLFGTPESEATVTHRRKSRHQRIPMTATRYRALRDLAQHSTLTGVEQTVALALLKAGLSSSYKSAAASLRGTVSEMQFRRARRSVMVKLEAHLMGATPVTA